jgi:integrase/recombinase XerC
MGGRRELVLQIDNEVARNRHIAMLTVEERKLLAAEAVQVRDADTLWAITAAFLSRRGRKGSNLSPNTLKQYERGVRELLLMWQHVNLLRPGPDAAANFIEDLRTGHTAVLQEAEPIRHSADPASTGGRRRKRSGKYSESTIAIKLSACKLFYRALSWTELYTGENPFDEISLGKLKTHVEQDLAGAHYSERELAALLDHAAQSPSVDDRLVLLLGAHAGLRVSEMLALQWTALRWDEGELLVVNGKGGKTASVVLSPALQTALLTQFRALRALNADPLSPGSPDRFVLTERRSASGIYKRLQRICSEAGVPFKGVHGLRHSAGTWMLHETGRIDLVQDHLRHETLDMARHYARGDRKALRRALQNRR